MEAAVVLDSDTAHVVLSGISTLVLLSGPAPGGLSGGGLGGGLGVGLGVGSGGGKPALLLEPGPGHALVAIGVGELGESRKYAASEVAAVYPLVASGPRWGIAVTVRGIFPQPQTCPALDSLEQVGELFMVRPGTLAELAPQPVNFTLAPAPSGTRSEFIATFRASQGSLSASMAALPVSTRGGSFILTVHEDGTLRAAFTSPRPRLTASAIAERLAARVDDPPPGMEACALS
ncbi:hypothetical protein T492DRAFT_501567 [Pavlovales sp. CCMP2436]|nr:hypothetical protein T492DRAFT_501567 [Pavlovales sp. CCMP2436]